MLGDFLYQLSARDGQQPVIDMSHKVVNSALAAPLVTVEFPIPEEHIFILNAMCLRASPGGVQIVQGLNAYYVPPGGQAPGTTLARLFDTTTNAAGGASGVWDGLINSVSTLPVSIDRLFHDLILPPKSAIRAVANFSAGVAANQIDLNVFGYFLPRGNISAI